MNKMEDIFGLVSKILKDIREVMSKDHDLNSFEIVPVNVNIQNKSPVLHYEHCLGLESWCFKYVYEYCYQEVMKEFLLSKKNPFRVCSDDSEHLLNVTLLLNPHLSSLWNKKRELLTNSLSDVNSEFKFSQLILSWKPKCNDSFAFRRWLVDAILKDGTSLTHSIESIVSQELRVCDITAEKSPHNYHSWNHRMWMIKRIALLWRDFDIQSLYLKEYKYSHRWTSKHISDFSGFHYRQFCIKNILENENSEWNHLEDSCGVNLRRSLVNCLEPHLPIEIANAENNDLQVYSENDLVNFLFNNRDRMCEFCTSDFKICKKLDVLFYELSSNNEYIKFYKSHETLWYHRRFVVHEILKLIYNYFGLTRQNGSLNKTASHICTCNDSIQKQAKIVKYDSSCVYSCLLYKVLESYEKKFIDERKIEKDNYAEQHERYLKFIVGLSFM